MFHVVVGFVGSATVFKPKQRMTQPALAPFSQPQGQWRGSTVFLIPSIFIRLQVTAEHLNATSATPAGVRVFAAQAHEKRRAGARSMTPLFPTRPLP